MDQGVAKGFTRFRPWGDENWWGGEESVGLSLPLTVGVREVRFEYGGVFLQMCLLCIS